MIALAFASVLTIGLIGCSSQQVQTELAAPTIDPTSNVLEVTSSDQILWNGTPITLSRLEELLADVAAMEVEPELTYRPSAYAAYVRSVDVLRVIRNSGITSFGFVGNTKYQVIPAQP